MRMYGAINKVERDATSGVLTISGIASSEAVDSDGETVTADAMRDALPSYMAGGSGPLREMHQPIAAGAVVHADVRKDGSTFIRARVVDRQAIAKIDEGVLRGFSIGGKALARDPDNSNIITRLRLTEISLVDRPANPECLFKVWSAGAAPASETAILARLAEMSEDERTALLLKAYRRHPVTLEQLLRRQAPPAGPPLDALERAFTKALQTPFKGAAGLHRLRGF